MKQRCLNEKHHTYPYYGARGIKVCDKWLRFEGFYEDMGDVPQECTLDRIDPERGYFKENCRWLHYKLQVRNLRKSIFVTMNGETKHLLDWCEILNLNYKVVFQRIKRDGLSPLEALNKPFRERKNG